NVINLVNRLRQRRDESLKKLESARREFGRANLEALERGAPGAPEYVAQARRELSEAELAYTEASSAFEAAEARHSARIAQDEANKQAQAWREVARLGEMRLGLAEHVESLVSDLHKAWGDLEQVSEEMHRLAPDRGD